MTVISPPKQGLKKRKGKARRVPTPAVPLVIMEHGHELRYARDELEVDNTAADPANPNRKVSRARHRQAYECIKLDINQREAADRYSVQHERQGGARWVNGERVGSSTPHWSRLPATEMQVLAASDLRMINKAIGFRATVLMRLLIIEDRRVAEIADRLGALPAVMTGEVLGVLTRMAEVWGILDGNSDLKDYDD